MRSHEQSLHDQFDPQAAAYLGRMHASGPDLTSAAIRVGGISPAPRLALDIGCGAGHLSFALAPHVQRITALDPSKAMLAAVRDGAVQRGVYGVVTSQGRAEQLPFGNAGFDLVSTRYSAHHWLDLPAALREVHRVLTPGGWLLIIDVLGEAHPLVDTWLQTFELLRDPSHVRNRSLPEWSSLLAAADFQLLAHESFATRMQFGPWVERMRPPAERVTALRALQQCAPTEVRDALKLEPNGSFTVTTGLLWARMAGAALEVPAAPPAPAAAPSQAPLPLPLSLPAAPSRDKPGTGKPAAKGPEPLKLPPGPRWRPPGS